MTIIYYKTKKTSATGQKIQNLIDRACNAVSEINQFVDELNSDRKYLMSDRCILGTGIAGLRFAEEPDLKIWKKFQRYPGYYSPRMSSKQGKAIQQKMNAFHRVERSEIGEAIGLNDFFKKPGLNIIKDSEYFGIIIDADWNHTMPGDCIEITATEYNSL